MAATTIKCAKLNQDLPGLDPESTDGDRALRMARLIGGAQLRDRIRDSVSAKAWELWTDHMRMIINEYRLDPTSDAASQALKPHMEAFFFGEQANLPGYIPPK